MAQSRKERLAEIDAAIQALQEERSSIDGKTDEPWPRHMTIYLHSSKESNYEDGEGLGLSEEALRNFVYACYEVSIDLEVDKDGSAHIVGVDGRPLQRAPGSVKEIDKLIAALQQNRVQLIRKEIGRPLLDSFLK